ncbi:MAG: 16S rRNA (guanine(966)-N(2))-methyltransferase RsmD [Ignavibacterium sp.]|jgi:16S rRNA (guanine966-N2)-methyltransferase|nr:16S rRNA (guanine(966)-N(2))-methyltransferase RsmD [Ignavibacterium sp.]
MRIRIISGIFKGRFITVPQSREIRPTTDRVKETLFNLLNNRIDFDGIEVLDFYSGSGSLGLECISRGAKHVTFVERDFKIYKNLLENIKSLSVEDYCKVIRMNATDYSNKMPDKQYDLILADPPFFKDDIYEVVKNILQNNYLKNDARMVVERSVQTKVKDIENFKTEPFKIIGDSCLYEIFQK